MAEFLQFGATTSESARRTVLFRLQAVTLAWMLVECGVSLYAAITAHSPAIFAFGSDSLVELFSAVTVLLPFLPAFAIPQRTATRIAALLLFVLAAAVTAIAIASFTLKLHPEASPAGIAITLAALAAMPTLAFLKRREAARTGNKALAADAVQSATCAWLALTALAGLGMNAAFHIPWVDPLAAIIAVPFLIREGRSAWRGNLCACCH